jgi:hypothetical protein
MYTPMEDHMQALQRISRYIQGTRHYGLHLYPSSTTCLISYIDALILDDLPLVTVCFLVITWYPGRPNGNPLYLALELKPNTMMLPILWSMNHGDTYLLGNLVQHQRTKYVEMKILHVPSRYQITYIFVKGLPLILFHDLKNSLSIRQPPLNCGRIRIYYQKKKQWLHSWLQWLIASV